MANRDRKKIRKNLRKKGFEKSEGSGHEQWTFKPHGLLTPITTSISRGSSYKVYGDDLLKWVRMELELPATQDLLDLIDCPMTQEKYEDHLIGLGHFDAKEAAFLKSQRKQEEVEDE